MSKKCVLFPGISKICHFSSNGFSDRQHPGQDYYVSKTSLSLFLLFTQSLAFCIYHSLIQQPGKEKKKKNLLSTDFCKIKCFIWCVYLCGYATHLNTENVACLTSSESHRLLHHTHQLFAS